MRAKARASFLCCLLTLVLLLHLTPIRVQGYADTVDEVQNLIDGIAAYQLRSSGADSVEEWIGGEITAGAGVTSDWYAIALSQSGTYDLSSYRTALETYIANNQVASATTRERNALALIAAGSTDPCIAECLDGAIGQQGIMSWVYGLHLLNNGCICSYDADSVVNTLLSLQCPDGGWVLSGDHGDVDVTAMTLQALAPHCSSRTDVQEAVNRAITFLSEQQQEDGGFKSFGTANPESVSQVLTALSALGIDCADDDRFIKNNQTLIDAIVKYRLPEGGFSHTEGDICNETATMQVYCALIAYQRMLRGQGSLFVFDQPATVPTETASSDEALSTAASVTDTDVSAAQTSAPPSQWGGSGRLIAVIVILCAGAAACLILFLLKKRNPKNFLFAAVLTAAGAVIVLFTDIRSAQDYYSGSSVPKEHATGTVTLAIRCDTIADASDSAYVPKDGVILPETEFTIEEGDTVFTILTEAAQQYSIQIENDGASPDIAYIKGINYIYETDFGELSGWVYHVNGVSASCGCSEYVLSDGDRIEWLYTRELGHDLNEVYAE